MKFSVKASLFAAGCVLLLVAGYLVGANAQKRRLPSSGFLQSTAAVIQLGVWDKAGNAKSNNTTFIVTAPDGKQYKATSSEPLDNWVYVSFPDNFSPYLETTSIYTTYSWKAVVDGKNVASGNFKWGNGQADDNNRNLK